MKPPLDRLDKSGSCLARRWSGSMFIAHSDIYSGFDVKTNQKNRREVKMHLISWVVCQTGSWIHQVLTTSVHISYNQEQPRF